MRPSRLLFAFIAASVALGAWSRVPSAESLGSGADLGAQAAADVIRTKAGTDIAFIVAGMFKPDYDKSKDLSTMLLYPDTKISIVKVTGDQLKQALERSVSLYPQANSSFLQLSGVEVTFNKSLSDGKRVVSAKVNGSPLNNSASYTVAMPTPIAEGGYGYYNVWDKPDIVKTLDPDTMESCLKGKPYTDSSPRWAVISSPSARPKL
jgi:2',3'-cyclic-nucleotide 2'-phosphodiesterase (5'-nucleotidase family)